MCFLYYEHCDSPDTEMGAGVSIKKEFKLGNISCLRKVPAEKYFSRQSVHFVQIHQQGH